MDIDPAAFGRLCVETTTLKKRLTQAWPAAFGRLCVETFHDAFNDGKYKHQPPSGGCVLKLRLRGRRLLRKSQPPSGGCVLKPDSQTAEIALENPAAFGRLCVETAMNA